MSCITTSAQAATAWENEGDFYFLTKNTRDYFKATGAGTNKFSDKYATYDGIDFLVRGADSWQDYGRLDLEGNNLFSLPLEPGIKIEEIHLLCGGNFGNSYKHDALLRLYGDNYYYGTITLFFVYEDGATLSSSVPLFWDWFHMSQIVWSKDSAKIRYVGDNPVRKNCTLYHASFANPRPLEKLRAILITDSWISDLPFSDIFAVTIKAGPGLHATPKENKKFKSPVSKADNEPADKRTEWTFSKDLEGWIPGASESWSVEAFWKDEAFDKKGVVIIPACQWSGDKFSWIEKKIALPDWKKITLVFSRHSAATNPSGKIWSDGLLKIIVKDSYDSQILYEKLYSGAWTQEHVDLTKYKNKEVIIRFENHGAGSVQIDPSDAAACSAEDAVLGTIQLKN